MYKVLCVDDDDRLVEVLSDMLQYSNYDARAVTSGAMCLELLNSGYRPDIILLDIMMFPMDGWETLRRIRNDKQLFYLPILMLTGKFPTMTEVEEYGTLFDGYLMKPFALESLSNEINNLMNLVKIREDIICRARIMCVDDNMLNEYRRLSSISRVLKKLEKIINNGSFTRDSFYNKIKRLRTIEKRLSECGILPPSNSEA